MQSQQNSVCRKSPSDGFHRRFVRKRRRKLINTGSDDFLPPRLLSRVPFYFVPIDGIA
jgi:hypothetical protein